jgi:hypothetical protein
LCPAKQIVFPRFIQTGVLIIERTVVKMKRETGEIRWIDSGAAPATVSEVFCFLPLCEIRMGRSQNNRDNTTLASPETGLISMKR